MLTLDECVVPNRAKLPVHEHSRSSIVWAFRKNMNWCCNVKHAMQQGSWKLFLIWQMQTYYSSNQLCCKVLGERQNVCNLLHKKGLTSTFKC